MQRPDDGRSKHLRNGVRLLPDYAAQRPEDRHLRAEHLLVTSVTLNFTLITAPHFCFFIVVTY